MRQTFTTAIVRPPSVNFASGLTTIGLGTPDFQLARQQHEAYCRALENCGLSLTRLETDPRYPDSTFVEDTAVLTERGAIVTRPGALSRRGETEAIKDALRPRYSSFQEIREPGTVDGGDVCEAAGHFLIGISRRTNEAGAGQLAACLKAFGYPSTLVDIRNLSSILHLKSGLAYLGGKRMLVIEEFRELQQLSGYELIAIDKAEAYAANCLSVNDRLLVAAGFPGLQRDLQGLGCETVPLEMSEFQKMDGGLSCLSLRL